MAQITNAQLVNNLKPYFATRRELQEIVVGGSGGVITEVVAGTALTGGGSTGIVTIAHNTGDFGDLHTNYAEHDQQETISDIWTHTADLQIQGANLTFVGTQTIQTNASSSLSISPDQNLTLSPGGDILFNPTGNDLLPVNNYDLNIGSISKKYLTLHAAELWVQTLVAQDVMATIGGRVLVGPTTYLHQDLAAGATTIYTKHNNYAQGDILLLEGNGQVEFLHVIWDPVVAGTAYASAVDRNLDGTGSNQWYAGDAVFNTGQPGDGFIDQYSVQGVNPGSTAGPTIVGDVRKTVTNLVLNASFETAGGGGADVFANWTESYSGTGTIQRSNTRAVTGTYSCRIANDSLTTYVSQDITVTASTDYVFGFYHWDDEEPPRYRIYDLSNAAWIVSWTAVPSSYATWFKRYIPFTTPVGCTSIRVYLSAGINGLAYFDDATVHLEDYANWTEHWAIGNLNGLYGVSGDTYGIGLGRPDKSYVLIDDTDGVTIRNSSANKLLQLDISGNATFGLVTASNANVHWDSGTKRLQFRGGAGGTTIQSYIDTDGSFVAGNLTNKDVIINTSGITLNIGTTYAEEKAITWKSGASKAVELYGYRSAGTATVAYLQTRGIDTYGYAYLAGFGSARGVAVLRAGVDGGNQVNIYAEYDPVGSGVTWAYTDGDFGVQGGLQVGGVSNNVGTGYARISNGLYVGGIGTEAASGNVQITNDFISNTGGIGLGNSGFSPGQSQIIWNCTISGSGLRPWDTSTYHQAYAYVPLQTSILVFNGVSRSGTSSENINISSSLPAYAKAVSLRLAVSAGANGSYYSISPTSSSQDHLAVQVVSTGWQENNGIVAINASVQRRLYGHWYVASGSVNIYLYVIGYFI